MLMSANDRDRVLGGDREETLLLAVHHPHPHQAIVMRLHVSELRELMIVHGQSTGAIGSQKVVNQMPYDVVLPNDLAERRTSTFPLCSSNMHWAIRYSCE